MPRRDARTLPAPYHTDPGYFPRELEAFFPVRDGSVRDDARISPLRRVHTARSPAGDSIITDRQTAHRARFTTCAGTAARGCAPTRPAISAQHLQQRPDLGAHPALGPAQPGPLDGVPDGALGHVLEHQDVPPAPPGPAPGRGPTKASSSSTTRGSPCSSLLEEGLAVPVVEALAHLDRHRTGRPAGRGQPAARVRLPEDALGQQPLHDVAASRCRCAGSPPRAALAWAHPTGFQPTLRRRAASSGAAEQQAAERDHQEKPDPQQARHPGQPGEHVGVRGPAAPAPPLRLELDDRPGRGEEQEPGHDVRDEELDLRVAHQVTANSPDPATSTAQSPKKLRICSSRRASSPSSTQSTPTA